MGRRGDARQAAVQAMAQEESFRRLLDVLDPSLNDPHLDYGELLQRLIEALGDEWRRWALLETKHLNSALE